MNLVRRRFAMLLSLGHCLVLSLLLAAPRALPAAEPAGGLPVVEPAKVGMSAAKLAELGPKLENFIAEGQISGAVTLVAKDGRIVSLTAIGQADLADKRPMKPDTLFAIASMTKPITAAALMILVDEGKVALDDPVAKFIPEFKDAKLDGGQALERPIAIRDVLTHTSGLGGDQQNIGTLENTGKVLAARPLNFQPGTKWQYSPGLSVCGRVIEVASGQKYEDFLRDRIFTPLGMSETTFFPTKEQQPRIARLYKPGEQPKTLATAEHWLTDLSADRTANPSGGLYSTAADVARFYQMILNRGQWGERRILSETAVAEMTKLQSGELLTGFTPGNGWGLGFCLVQKPQGVSAMLSPGSFGHGGAFGTQSWADPARQMIFILLVQRTNFGNSDAADLRAVFQRTAVDAIEK